MLARVAILLASLCFALPAVGQQDVGRIEGRVVNTDGAPVESAAVFIAGTELQTETDSQGRFVLDDVPVGNYTLQAGAAGFTVEGLEVLVADGTSAAIEFVLTAVSIPLDEVVVTSRFSLLTDQPVSTVSLSRDQIVKIPHFADDLFRAIQVLPGVSSGDFSAAFSVRGGLYDEILVRLDGHELFEPFHLRDFQGVFSAVDPEAVGGVDLMPGGFPVEYGDRMTAVLDMTTRRTTRYRGSLGISFSNAWINGGGILGDKGRWMGSARRGYLDVLLNFVGGEDEEEEGDADPDPSYWDAFAKFEWDFTPRQSASFKVHYTDDDLKFEEFEIDETVLVETGYDSSLVGFNHAATIGDGGLVETLASHVGVGRDRAIDAFEDDGEFVQIFDFRDTEVLSLRQDWSWQFGDRQYWKWGFELRNFETEYDYFNEFDFDDPINDPRFLPASGLTRFEDTFASDYYAVYLADRIRLAERFTLELGARWDDYELTGDSNVAPRVNLVVELPTRAVLRAGWGHFYQSQRTNELAVGFGDTEFSGTQRAEHWTLGFEKLFDRGYTIRLDLYNREVRDPIVRYETLFAPLSPAPEVSRDRIQIAADRVEAQGAELYLRGPVGNKFSWWVTYVYSEITDVLPERDQFRSNDQPHAFTWNSAYRLGEQWEFNWLWTWHTGWPATSIVGEAFPVPGQGLEIQEIIGPFYEERYSDYHRLDLRVSRRSKIKLGTLTFFLDVQNLYDRGNIAGVDLDEENFERLPGDRLVVTYGESEWLGIIPSFGVSWEF